MDNTLFLIDGMAYAFRAFHAIRSGLSDPKGRPTNAVYGFTRIVMKILREHEPSHLAVVFDAPGKSFRDEMYPEYKATRSATPPELKEQFPRMQALVRALNIPLYVEPGVEADDVIATLARQAEAQGMNVVVVSGDKDLLQLVSPGVRMFDPSKGDAGEWFDAAEVRERFGTDPARMVDALALIGDSADNVPGVRGIGPKTAKTLLEKYGGLEQLYESLHELKGKQKENLEADRDQAFFSRELVTLKTDVPLEHPVAECQRRAPHAAETTALLEELGFNSLRNEWFPAESVAEAETPPDYRLVTDEAALDEMIARLRAAGRFAVDTETTSVDPLQAELVGLSFSCEDHVAYYVPVGHTPEARVVFSDPDDLTSAEQWPQLDKALVLSRLKPLLEDPAIGKIGHNIKYDLLVLQGGGVMVRGIEMDTMIASYLTDPSRLRHNLDEVCLKYLRQQLIPISDLIGTGPKAITFDNVSLNRACAYAAEDADCTWRLCKALAPVLRERQLETLCAEIELPLIAVLARMESAGIAIDPAVFEGLREEVSARLGVLEQTIYSMAGQQFNINSPKQLQHILFESLGLTPERKTKTGYSTDVDVLEQLALKHPLPAQLLEYRTLEKLRGTYIEALPKMVHPGTGRIHTSFNQAVAATGRLSSSAPNLQNIPIRTELGRQIRRGFVPGKVDQRLISADYSQIELRILAHLSGDAALISAFEQDADVHRETAARIFNTPPATVTPEMRRQSKAINFGVIYGMSSFGLAKNLGISNAEAARFIAEYFAQYPGVRTWLDECLAQARERGYVETLFHRRRYMPELTSSDPNLRKAAERAAINMPVQGAAADIIKVAMLRVDAALENTGARMLLQVHDELLVEAPEASAEAVAETVRHEMESACALRVPLKVDVGVGRNWAEIH